MLSYLVWKNITPWIEKISCRILFCKLVVSQLHFLIWRGPALQGWFSWCGGMTQSMFVLHWIILFWEKKHNTQFHIKTVVFNLQIFTWLESYYKVNLFSVVIRHDLYLYYTIDICTTQSISVLHILIGS